MTTGRMLEQEIERTDALAAQLERLYAYLESTCPPDFVVEAKRAAAGNLGEDVSCDEPGQLQGATRSAKRPQLIQPEAVLSAEYDPVSQKCRGDCDCSIGQTCKAYLTYKAKREARPE